MKTVWKWIVVGAVVVCGNAMGELIADWGGNYVSAHNYTPALTTETDDYDGDGLTDWHGYRSWSTSIALSPGSDYSGTSATYYGGISMYQGNSTAGDYGWDRRIYNSGNNDLINNNIGTGITNNNGDCQAVYVWLKSDFLNNGDISTVTFDSNSSLSLELASETFVSCRFLVRDNSTWYISSNRTAVVGTFSVANPDATQWAEYTPNGTDLKTWGSYSSHTFSDVTGVGYYSERTSDEGDWRGRVSSFEVDAVLSSIPEPTTGLLFVLAVSLLAIARRRVSFKTA